jgi:lipoprotein-releasing system ATP-binding protein
MSVLHCHGVTRAFITPSQTVSVLTGIDLTVIAGEVVAILGPSGSGKSTLLHLLAGLDRPTSGEIYWGTRRIAGETNHTLAQLRLTHIGLVFQDHYLLEDLTVLENVTLSGRLQGTVDIARATQLLRSVGLSERDTYLPRKLSGGERQRVAVARALYGKPKIILADEPTGSLDRENARGVYHLLVDLAKTEGTAVVMVTHDEGLVTDVDQRYYLERGALLKAKDVRQNAAGRALT